MAQLRQDYQKFVERDAEILVVSPENQKQVDSYWQKERFPFPGLADPDHEVADRYGQEVKLLKLGRLPALMLIDKQGQVRYAHYGDSMQDFASNAELLQVIEQINREEAPLGVAA